MGAGVIGNGLVWSATPDKAAYAIYGTSIFEEAEKLGLYLRAEAERNPGPDPRPSTLNARPDLTLAVIGSEPEIYFYSHLRSATGFLYTYPMMEPQPFAAKMQEDMMAEIERARPEYVVYVSDDLSWLRLPNSDTRIDGLWKSYWSRNLDLVNTYPIQQLVAAEDKYLLLLKRKTKSP
jgi:hypothetical protein